MLAAWKRELAAGLAEAIRTTFGVDHAPVAEVPPRRALGDLAFPAALHLARTLKRKPREIAEELVRTWRPPAGVREIRVEGAGYLNVYFDRPAFPLRHNPFVLGHAYRGADFWNEILPFLENPANGVIVDSDAFYPRYFNPAVQARLPERVHLYKMLFTGQGSPFRLVARIVSHGPWWLDPRPELVSPEMVIFATRAVVPDSAVMSPMAPARADVMQLMPR